jgi:hypothetical protein
MRVRVSQSSELPRPSLPFDPSPQADTAPFEWITKVQFSPQNI